MPILCIFTPTFWFLRKACLLYKASKIVFARSIFRFYDIGIQGLQGVTRGDKGLQGVTRRYKGLQGVTKGYRGLQGVTRGLIRLQRIIETFF